MSKSILKIAVIIFLTFTMIGCDKKETLSENGTESSDDSLL